MRITRREFIKGAAVAVLTLEGAQIIGSVKGEEEIFETARELMGSTARITLMGRNENRAKEAANQAYNRMQRVDKLMSIFREDSEISILNKHGQYGGISPETAHVIKKANHYSKLSNGAFDISILPTLESITDKEAIPQASYEDIVIEDRNIRFLKRGMKITLGGIGIGHALDHAVAVLKSFGIEHAMINIGGDIMAIGDNADGGTWKVGIEDPVNRNKMITTIDLKDRAVATSGNYQKQHILNPQTGKYPSGLISTTIMAQTALDADAVATTVYVLGVEKGMKFINNIDGVEGLLITDEHKVLRSAGFKSFEI